MASVINPGRRRETSLLDVINTGLNVAQTYAAMKSKSAQEEMAQKQFETEQQSAADKQAGILSQGDLQKFQAEGYQEAPADYKGPGITVGGIRTPQGVSAPKMLFKAPEAEKPSLLPGEGGLYSVTKQGAELVPGSAALAKKAEPKAVTTKEYEDAEGNKRLGVMSQSGKLLKSADDAIIASAKASDKNEAKNKFESLPPESKKEIEKLATDNATRSSIANLLKSDIEQFNKAKTADEKVVIGRGMLKTLNSLLGSDATGVEEVKRLGSLLERYNMPGEPGNFFSRDVEGFIKQVNAKIAGAEGSVKLNNERINDLYRSGGQAEMQVSQDSTDEISMQELAKQELLRREKMRQNAQNSSGRAQ